MSNSEEAVPEPSEDPATPPRVRRLLGVFKKKAILLSLAAVAVVAIDAVVIVAVNGWKADADDLEAEALSLGQQVASNRAQIEEAETEIGILESQREAAAARALELTGETETELGLVEEITEVVLDLEECTLDRFRIVRGLWERGSASVSSLDAQTKTECAAALSTLNQLITEVG